MPHFCLADWQQSDIGFRHWRGPGDSIAALDLRPAGATGGGLGLFCTKSDPSRERGVHVVLGDDPEGALKPAVIQSLNQRLGRTVSGIRLDAISFDIFTRLADPAGSRQRPLIPGSKDRRLKLRLGPLFVAEQFDVQTHPHRQQVFDVLHEDYKAARARDRLAGSDNYLHELGDVVFRKFPGLDPRLIQQDLPDEKPLKPRTTIVDNFNRADAGSLGTSSEGTWSWTSNLQGNWDIASNEASADSASHNNARADLSLDSADHYAEGTCTISGAGGVRDIGVLVQVDSSANSGYLYLITQLNSNQLWRFTNGSYTLISTGDTTSAASNSLMRLERDGNDLEGFFEGVSEVTGTDSTHTANRRCGLRAFNHDSTVDDFEAGDLAAAANPKGPLGHPLHGPLGGPI